MAYHVSEDIDKRFDHVRRSKTFNRILDTVELRDKKVLDLGCAYGEHLVLFGNESLGITSTTEEVAYGNKRNIRIIKGNVELIDTLDLGEQFQALWANNLLEHLLSPHAFLMKLKMVAQPDTLLVVGVPVLPRIASFMRIKKFRGALAVAHINFFTRETLRITVERSGWIVTDVRPFVFTNAWLDRMFSFFAPHLYVIARNDPDFMYPDKKLKEWQDEPLYETMLKIGARPRGSSQAT